jgi:lambda family phage portal protein
VPRRPDSSSFLDRAIAAVSPVWGLRRLQARQVLSYYEAARPNRQRLQRRETGSANTAIRAAGHSIREQARHLEQNHDLSKAVLRELSINTVGAQGIGVEPVPRTRSGEVHEDFAAALGKVYERWSYRPEVTRRRDWAEEQRLLARSAYRDGEVLCRLIEGVGPQFRHTTGVPLSVQGLEADHLPLGYDTAYRTPDDVPGGPYDIRDGIELNAWGEARAYWLWDRHPAESLIAMPTPQSLRRVPAGQVLHLARVDRLHQRRGMSEFAAIIERLDDLRDYEGSEAVAAKVAASLSAAIVKGSPDLYVAEQAAAINAADGTAPAREMKFRAGMIFDDLRPGESVEMIGNNGRPNPSMINFRYALLRAVAAGPGCTFSSIAKFYDGSYSSQRQELVEAWMNYAVLSSWFVSQIVRPVYERLVGAALLSGQLAIPQDLDPATVTDALYIPPSMPWIDPRHEAEAWEKLEQAGHASGPEIVRRRGRNPREVRDAEIAWRKSWRERGEQITADPASVDITTVPDAPTEPGKSTENPNNARTRNGPGRR